jgi:hypothetical protein
VSPPHLAPPRFGIPGALSSKPDRPSLALCAQLLTSTPHVFVPCRPLQRRCFRTMTMTAQNFAREARESSQKIVMLWRNECDSIAGALLGAAGGSGGGGAASGGGTATGAKVATRRGGARRKDASKGAANGARYAGDHMWGGCLLWKELCLCYSWLPAQAMRHSHAPPALASARDDPTSGPNIPFTGPSWPSSVPSPTGSCTRTSA